MRRFTVKTEDREREVFIVGTEKEMKDESYMNYLEVAEKEKTLDQLKKIPPRPQPTMSKKEIGKALKERLEFDKRKREGGIKKYY